MDDAPDTAVVERTTTIIESIGTYLPPKVVSTKEVLRACTRRILFPLERLTGIRFRRMAGDGEFSIDLARKAIENCLKRSEYEAEDIDLLICCNISRYDGPDFNYSFEPSTSIKLKRDLGLTNALAFDISNACAGMFTGVHAADGYIKAGLARRALVVSGEYITHLTRTAQREIEGMSDSRLACLTLGDSGVAVLLEKSASPEYGFQDIEMFTLGRYSDYCIAKPTAREHGGAIMFTESLKLHTVAIKNSVRHAIKVLKKVQWPRKKLHYFIMHQTARSAIRETARQLNAMLKEEWFNRDNCINNLEDRGNTSTTTHFLAAYDNIINGRIQSGDSVLFVVQASGITLGTAPYVFDDLPERLRNYENNGQTPLKVARSETPDLAQAQQPRIRIESVGIVPDSAPMTRDGLELAGIAAEDCFSRSSHSRNEIDLLLHSGVYRNEFLCEPALAAIVAGNLNVNEDADPESSQKTFAFDIFNGALGYLNACYTAVAMLSSGKFRRALVVSAEIENNAKVMPDNLLGIRETGSAMILDKSPDGRSGFGRFLFRYFTEYIDAFQTALRQNGGTSFLSFHRDPELDQVMINCICETVEALLRREKLDISKIKAIFPPQVSPQFIRDLSDRLNVVPARIINIAQDGKDLFSNSLAYAFSHAREKKLVDDGDIGMIIGAGSGLQVGCALYYF